jgi:hypothetical protein
MARSRRKFTRLLGTRNYKKLFVISCEGSETEIQYFSIVGSLQTDVLVKCLRDKHKSSPNQVLKRMINYLKDNTPQRPYESWLVVDKDSWTDEQLTILYAWTKENQNYNLAVSNPKFEYWLLLHFEEGTGFLSSESCNDRLRRYLENYDKHLDIQKFPKINIEEAIKRAKYRDNPPCTDWPRMEGRTTTYKLVEHIFNA